MAYFGKEFAVDREENYDTFIKSLELPPAMETKYINYRPKTKLEKDGDSYISTTESSDGTRTTSFKSGVEFEETLAPGITIKSKYTVDGDTITQEIEKDDKTVTFKREYSEDELKVTITASFFDGVAVRYYKPV